MADEITQTVAHDWVSFPGGELEGRRPRTLCHACREALKTAAIVGARAGRRADRPRAGGMLCFQCYRANLDRERALREAGALYTASEARFQTQLPFEPINEGRLAVLKQERAIMRGQLLLGTDRFADRRRQAQIAARRALQSALQPIVASRQATTSTPRASASSTYDGTIAAAIHAAELQLPESWLPFVVAR